MACAALGVLLLTATNASAGGVPDVTGFWRDAHGDRIWIQSQNGHVKMVAPSGSTFIGTQSGDKLDLTAPFRGSEVTDAPPAVQDKVDAMKALTHFTGTIDASGLKISGLETKPDDVRWDGADNITAFRTSHGTRVTLVSAIKANAFIADVDASVRP
jgi:hypothetical protein